MKYSYYFLDRSAFAFNLTVFGYLPLWNLLIIYSLHLDQLPVSHKILLFVSLFNNSFQDQHVVIFIITLTD